MMDERFDAVIRQITDRRDLGENWAYTRSSGEVREVQGLGAREAAVAMARVLATEMDPEKLRIKTVTGGTEKVWRFEMRLAAVKE